MADNPLPQAGDMGAGATAPLPSGPIPTVDSSGASSGGGGINLSDFLSSIAANNQNINSSVIPGIQKSLAAGNTASSAMVDAMTQKASDDALVTQTQQTGQLRAQQNLRAVASSLGTNMDDSSQILTQLGQTMLQEYQSADEAGKNLDQLKSIGFWDDPIGWIGAQTQMKSAEGQYNQHANSYNRAEATMQQLLALTEADNKVQNDIAQTKDAASVAAATDSVKQAALAQADEASMKAAQFNIAGMEAIQKMNTDQLSSYSQGLTAVINQGHYAIAQKQLVIAQNLADQEATIRQESIKKSEMDIAQQKDTEDTINRGLTILGRQPLVPGKASQILRVGGEAGDLLRKAYTIGNSTAIAGTPIISTNTGDAARTIISTRAPLTPSMEPVKNLLTDAFHQVASGAIDKTIDVKNPQAVDFATTKLAISRAAVMQSGIDANDKSNIYSPPDLKSISTVPGVATSPLFQKVLEPIVASGATHFDPQLIAKLTATGVANGTISYNDGVKGLAAIGNAAVVLNNVNKNYVGVGLPLQAGLNMKVPNTFFGYRQTVDFTDKTAIGNYLTQQMQYLKTPAGQGITAQNAFSLENLLGTGNK